MKTVKLLATLLALSAILASCAKTQTDANCEKSSNEDNNKVVYSVYLRNYTNSEAAGTFADLQADLPRIKELGVDVIHLLPIYEMGVEHAKGSPYCIRDYRSVDPRYGTLEQMKELIDSIHASGMEIWLDWVGNHTAYDNPWVTEHPDWYTERQDFDDVRSVNSANPELRKAMADAMRWWVEECDIDGFRCDFAQGPGLEFWTDIISQVDPEHKLFWLAEGDEGGIANTWMRGEGGPFDSRYGWSYGEFLYTDKNNVKDVSFNRDFNKAVFHLGYPAERAAFLTYLGSHDIFQGMDNSVSPATQDEIYGDNLAPLTVMTMLAPGIPMVYMGQEINFSQPGGVGIMTDTEAVDWTRVDTTYLSLVKELIRLRHTQPALATTPESVLLNHTTNNDSVYVYERRRGDESVIVALNFSYNPQTFEVTSLVFPKNSYTETFTGAGADFSKNNVISLPGKGYAVYTKSASEPLVADKYVITVRSDESLAEAPKLCVTVPDPLGKGGDLTVVPPTEMMFDSGNELYTLEIYYLPEFGYDLTVTSGDKILKTAEETSLSKTYTLN